MAREPQIILATGMRGVGKTFKTESLIQEYLTPDISIGKKARKVLIFDVNGEYTNEEIIKNGFRFRIKTLALKDLAEWTQQSRIEVRRILPVDAKGNEVGIEKYREILNYILHYYRGGMLVLEDINKYLTETKDAKVVGALIANRHKDLDIYIHLQSLSKATTTMIQNANVIRFHYQLDDISRYTDRLPNSELFLIAQTMVATKYFGDDKRFFVYIMNEYNVLRGNFTLMDFIAACRQYLELHPSKVKQITQKYGKGYEAKMKATKECILELYNKYYGNKPLTKKKNVTVSNVSVNQPKMQNQPVSNVSVSHISNEPINNEQHTAAA